MKRIWNRSESNLIANLGFKSGSEKNELPRFTRWLDFFKFFSADPEILVIDLLDCPNNFSIWISGVSKSGCRICQIWPDLSRSVKSDWQIWMLPKLFSKLFFQIQAYLIANFMNLHWHSSWNLPISQIWQFVFPNSDLSRFDSRSVSNLLQICFKFRQISLTDDWESVEIWNRSVSNLNQIWNESGFVKQMVDFFTKIWTRRRYNWFSDFLIITDFMIEFFF